MTLNDFIAMLELTCSQVVADEARQIAAEIRERTPVNRVRTRQAVRVRRNGTRARVLLQFPRRFPGTDTPTHKRFRTQWAQLRPVAKKRVIARLALAMGSLK